MAMGVLEYVIVVLALCIILCALALWQKVLDIWGTSLAFIIGAVIGIFGGILWLALLIFFLITSFGATKYKYSLKKEKGVSEGKRGERHFKNVLANGLAPTYIALISYEVFHFIEDKWMAAVVFVSVISVAAADTMASELGVMSDKAYLITNIKKRVKKRRRILHQRRQKDRLIAQRKKVHRHPVITQSRINDRKRWALLEIG